MCTTRRFCAFRASCLLLVAFLASPAILIGQTDIPRLISYQGLLTDPSTGDPVADGAQTIVFRLYESDAGGSAIWVEQQVLTTTNGVFNAILGSEEKLSMAFTRKLWLSIEVAPDPEMTDRIQLTSAPYALGLSMPYADTVENSGTMLELYNEGLGGVGRFVVDNPASSSPVLYLETNGTGLGLEVDGIIRADSVGFTSPLKRYASVHGSAFSPGNQNSTVGWTRDFSGGYYTAGTGYYAFAPIDIPDGAVIVDFSCSLYDTSVPENLVCLVCRASQGGCISIGFVTSSGLGGMGVYSTTVTPKTVNHATESIYLLLYTSYTSNWSTHGSGLRIYEARVGYTVSAAG